MRRRVDVARVRRSIPVGNHGHRVAGLGERNTGPQPRNRLEEEAAVVQLRGHEKRHFGGPRHPHVELIQRKRAGRFGENADDGPRLPIQGDGLSKDRRLAVEVPLPEAMADEDDRLAAGPIFGGRKIPSDERLDAQRWQERHGRVEADHLFRVAAPGQRERIERGQRQVAEHLLPLLHLEKARIGKADAVEVLLQVGRAQSDQAVRLRIRQRPEEHRIHHAEQRHVGADAEREAEDGNEREARRLDQLTDGVAQPGMHGDLRRYCGPEIQWCVFHWSHEFLRASPTWPSPC